MSNIPSVNLSDFLSNDKELKDAFVNKVGKAYQEIGFLSLKGHFLSKENVDDLYTQIKIFFDLPLTLKIIMSLMDLKDKEDIPHLERNMPRVKKKVI